MRTLSLAALLLWTATGHAQAVKGRALREALRLRGNESASRVFDGAASLADSSIVLVPPDAANVFRPAGLARGAPRIQPAPRLVMGSEAEGPLWEDAFSAVYETLRKNLRTPRNRPAYAQPSPRYPGVYLWDSAFIAEVWRLWDPAVAEDIIASVLRNQQGDGRVPHVRSILGTSEWSNPPLLSWSAMRLYRQTGNRAFLEQVYPALRGFHAWYQSNRRLSNGLFYWKHPYESGLDNSPRFADRRESRFDDTTRLMAVDLSAYVALDAENLAEMAEALGLSGEAQDFRATAGTVKALINEHLWDEERQAYFDRNIDTGRFVHVLSVASLVPLTAGVPSAERAKLLVGQILDPKLFNTPTPFPSVARSDPAFEKDCWRGPVWVNMAYLAILGLERYGYGAEAKDLSRRLVDGVYKTWGNTGKFVEYYDPERLDLEELSRKRGNLYKRLTLGDKPVSQFVGWTGLVNNLAVEQLGYPVKR